MVKAMDNVRASVRLRVTVAVIVVKEFEWATLTGELQVSSASSSVCIWKGFSL